MCPTLSQVSVLTSQDIWGTSVGTPVSQPWEFRGHSRPLIAPFLVSISNSSQAAGTGSWELVRFPHTKGVNPWSSDPRFPPQQITGRGKGKNRRQGGREGGSFWVSRPLVGPALCLPRSISHSYVAHLSFPIGTQPFPSLSPWGAGRSTWVNK